MFRNAIISVAKCVPQTLAQPTGVKATTAKAQAGAREPSHQLSKLEATTQPTREITEQKNDALDDLLITSYSPWDPCATRPLLSSGLPIPNPKITLRGVWGNTNLRIAEALARIWEPTLRVQDTVPQPSESKALVKKPATKALTVTRKPWPYTLPKFLQPKAGTTYHATYGGNASAESRKPTSIIQAILYGIPEPDEYEYGKEIVQGKIIKEVLYGKKDEAGSVTAKVIKSAEVTAAQVAEVKDEKPTEMMVVKKDVAKTQEVEVEHHKAITVIAK